MSAFEIVRFSWIFNEISASLFFRKISILFVHLFSVSFGFLHTLGRSTVKIRKKWSKSQDSNQNQITQTHSTRNNIFMKNINFPLKKIIKKLFRFSLNYNNFYFFKKDFFGHINYIWKKKSNQHTQRDFNKIPVIFSNAYKIQGVNALLLLGKDFPSSKLTRFAS